MINDESDSTGDGTDKDYDFDWSSNSGESENREMFKSPVTGRTKYMRRSKAKDDINTAELEFLQTIGPKNDEESIFGDLIASQLRQLQYHEKVMAKMEINNVLYAHLLKENSPNQAYSAGGFLTQDQRCDDMPHIYRHTNAREATPPPMLSFAPTEMQSADNHVFPQGQFFQQLRLSQK